MNGLQRGSPAVTICGTYSVVSSRPHWPPNDGMLRGKRSSVPAACCSTQQAYSQSAKLQRSNVCMFLVQEARNQASNRPRVSNNVFYTVIHNVATHYALHTMYRSDSNTSAAAAAASFFSTVSGSAAGNLYTARAKGNASLRPLLTAQVWEAQRPWSLRALDQIVHIHGGFYYGWRR